MIKIFNLIFDFIKQVITSEIVALTCTVAIALILGCFLILLLFVALKGKNGEAKLNLKPFSSVCLVACILSLVFAKCESVLYGELFKDELSLCVFGGTILCLYLLEYGILSATIKPQKPIKTNHSIIPTQSQIKKDVIEEPLSSKAIETIKCVSEQGSVYSGYLDVSYVKELIGNLKKYPIEYDEERQLEDFEVYLLNFANRQPTSVERQELGEYMGKLIKTLAKYSAV